MKRLLKKNSSSSLHKRYIFINCFVLVTFVCTSVQAILPLGINGNVDISYGETNNNNNSQEQLHHKYSFNWSKKLFSQINLRSSYRYSKSNITQNSENPIWQEVQQPTFDMVWNNSYITFNVNNNYQTTDATISTLQVSRKSWSAYVKTKSLSYPIITLKYLRNHSYNNQDLSVQNLYENRYQANLNHSFKRSTIHYGFTKRFNDNKLRELKSTQDSHILRLSDNRYFYNKKLSLSANYSMNYNSQTDERKSDTYDFYLLPIISGLYTQTSNYTLDSLYKIPSLNDGNLIEFVQPTIDIGGTLLNQNIGVDFGYSQDVSALYLYLNRYTDKQYWDVYISEDNLEWELLTSSAVGLFNSSYNRIEVIFPTVQTRYIKIVNLDISEIDNVFVTEIQALEKRDISEISKSTTSSHNFDINSAYKYSKNISSNLGLSYKHIPGQFGGKSRDNLSYSVSNRYKQSNKISHSMRWTHNMQYFHGAAQNFSNLGLNYHLRYKPLEKLEFGLSSNLQLDYIDGMKNRKSNSVQLKSKSTPLDNLNVSIDLSYSRSNQYLSVRKFDSWNQRFSFDGNITRYLSLNCSYSHRSTNFNQMILDENSKTNTFSNQYVIGIRYRFTSTIFARSSFNINKSIGYYFSQNYMISWNPSRKLSLSGQMRLQNDNNTRDTRRYNSQLSYRFGNNANLYVSYMMSDLSGANGDKNNSIRVGFRSGI